MIRINNKISEINKNKLLIITGLMKSIITSLFCNSIKLIFIIVEKNNIKNKMIKGNK